MAAAFAQLPARVLWRLSNAEVPDEAALAELRLGNNTKVGLCLICPVVWYYQELASFWQIEHPICIL